MNEFEAAMGLCMLDEIKVVLSKRKEVYERYEKVLKDVVTLPKHNDYNTRNYGYFPIILKDETTLKKVQKALSEEGIFPRRYFYPSLDTLGYIEPKQYMPLSRDMSSRILALPMYSELSEQDQIKIIEIIKGIV